MESAKDGEVIHRRKKKYKQESSTNTQTNPKQNKTNQNKTKQNSFKTILRNDNEGKENQTRQKDQTLKRNNHH